MTDRSEPANAPHETEDVAHSRLVPQLGMMLAALVGSPVRNTLVVLSASLAAVIALTAFGQIRLNSWNQPFYDSLAHRDLGSFFHQLGVFGVIAALLLALNVAQKFLVEMLKVKLREGLVRDLVEHWLEPMRAFRLASAGTIGINPDQRMHEDARHLTELSADLGAGLAQAGVLLTMFVGVLWRISSNFALQLHGHAFAIRGYMVWAALLYAGSASLLSYWVGRPLIERNATRYAREADLRFALVRVNEHVDAIALAKGEADEARRIERDFDAVLDAMKRLVFGLTNLTWITAGYGWFTLVAPILAAAPLYFSSKLSFGGLMMAAGAFTQVQTSMRWFIDNFSVIADWRATLLRVASFRRAVITMDTLHSVEGQIASTRSEESFRIDRLEIASPAGATMIQEPSVEIRQGDRVLIVGEVGTGKTLLFRALAGLWPWGSGTIARPQDEKIMYMPRAAYWPPGSLRSTLAYPRATGDFEDAAYQQALRRLGLERLIAVLDQAQQWEQTLSEHELTRLTLARVLLQAPPWIIIDEVLDSLETDTLALANELFAKELKASAIVHIGRCTAHDRTFKRVLHLVKDPHVRRLPRKRLAARRPDGATHAKSA